MRQVVDGICAVARGGIAWRALPRAAPPWPPVAGAWRAGRREGTGACRHAVWRRAVRKREERATPPTAGRMDAPSVHPTTPGAPEHGEDAGQQDTGRQRPLGVAPRGRLRVVVVHAAGVQARDGAQGVEQTPLRVAWMASRLRQDEATLPASSEPLGRVAMSRLLLRRLT